MTEPESRLVSQDGRTARRIKAYAAPRTFRKHLASRHGKEIDGVGTAEVADTPVGVAPEQSLPRCRFLAPATLEGLVRAEGLEPSWAV
jgi:hypothetical protein